MSASSMEPGGKRTQTAKWYFGKVQQGGSYGPSRKEDPEDGTETGEIAVPGVPREVTQVIASVRKAIANGDSRSVNHLIWEAEQEGTIDHKTATDLRHEFVTTIKPRKES